MSVTYELATHVFCPTGTWARDIRKGFLILVLASVAIALGLACLPSPPEKTILGMLLDRGNLFSSALQCELLVGMIAFSSTAGLPWNTHVARIAQGLGFYSLIGLLTEAGHNILARNTDGLSDLDVPSYVDISPLCVLLDRHAVVARARSAGTSRGGTATTLYFAKTRGIRSSQAPGLETIMTIRNLEFFGFLLVFLISILGIGTYYYLQNRRRELYPYGKWDELLKRLAPMDHHNLERIALDPAAASDHEIQRY